MTDVVFDSDEFDGQENIFTYEPKPAVSPYAISYENINIGFFKLDFDYRVLYQALIDDDNQNPFIKYTDSKIISDIRKNILTSYEKYCRITGNMKEKVCIESWYNISYKDAYAIERSNDMGIHSYLSGSVFVRGYDPNFSTEYNIANRDEVLYIKDRSCNLVLFPSWLPYSQSVEYKGLQPRLSIDFNLYPMRFYDELSSIRGEQWTKNVYTP